MASRLGGRLVSGRRWAFVRERASGRKAYIDIREERVAPARARLAWPERSPYLIPMTDRVTDRDIARGERRRRNWPVVIRPLGVMPSDDLADALTAEERIALVWTLSARMWELTGRPFPTYARADIPVSVVRGR
jgi:hypothetical protein